MDSKIVKEIENAINKNDKKLVEKLQKIVREEYMKFYCFIRASGEAPTMELSKDGFYLELNVKEMKELLQQLKVAEKLDWNLPF